MSIEESQAPTEITLEHPEHAAEMVGGPSFERYANALSARNVYWATGLFAVANLLFWPTDLLVFERGSELAEAFVLLRLGFITISVITILAMRFVRPARRNVSVVFSLAAAVALAVAALTVVPTWSPGGGDDLSWFHSGYLTPLVTLCLNVPFGRRVVTTFLLPVLCGALFYATNPQLVSEVFIGTPLLVWIFASIVSVAVGQVHYRLLRLNFKQRRALSERSMALEQALEGQRGVVAWLNEVNEQLSQQVEGKTAKLGQLLEGLERARREERQRMSKRLDEEVVHHLHDLRISLSLARQQTQESQDVVGLISRIDDRLNHALDSAEDLAERLTAKWNAHRDFAGSVRKLVDSVSRRASSEVRLSIQPDEFHLPENQATRVFDILEEAVSNAVQHAQAADITITVTYAPGKLRFRVADNGRGLPSHGAEEVMGRGLREMRANADAVGGTLTIDSDPGRGTRVDFELSTLAVRARK